MKIILKKVRKKTPFTWVNPIKVEPLELEYLKTVLDDIGLESHIVDALFKKHSHLKCQPLDIIILNGYNTARDQMMLEAKRIKAQSKETIVIGSGVDVQVNFELYLESDFDYLVNSNRLDDFKALIEHIVFGKKESPSGVIVLSDRARDAQDKEDRNKEDRNKQDRHKQDNGISALNSNGNSIALRAFEPIHPSRTYFDQIKSQTRYLLYQEVALVKRSHGCPYQCEFCFCKQLNQGHLVSRTFEDLKNEMTQIQAKYFWVVDDVFIHNEAEAKAFLEAFKNTAFKMIVYLRADFIASHPEIMKSLKAAGIIEVIVGFESIKANFLEGYKKGYTPDINTGAIKTLKHCDLSYTALFMMDIGDLPLDFKALKHYIKTHDIENYTFSIFTPLRGTDVYKQYEGQLIDHKCEHYDF